MAVSVRMDPLMEKELELAAKRQGVTKSQFIIAAVARALGHKDPAALYHKVMADMAAYRSVRPETEDAPPSALQEKLRTQYAAEQEDYAAYVKEREAAKVRGAST